MQSSAPQLLYGGAHFASLSPQPQCKMSRMHRSPEYSCKTVTLLHSCFPKDTFMKPVQALCFRLPIHLAHFIPGKP